MYTNQCLTRPASGPPATATLDRVASLDQPGSRRDRRRRRDELLDQRRNGVRRAQLLIARAVLADAETVVHAGWIQHGWYEVIDRRGRPVVIGSHQVGLIGERPITAACLVGAIVQVGGGPVAAHSQPVSDALELAWHTLYRGGGRDDAVIDRGAAPAVRAARVRDLTRWNDRPERTVGQVRGLLVAAEGRAATELAAG